MLHIYYGDGKGKTTAAMGLALRALGHEKHVTILQFLKDGSSGEIALLRRCGADVHACPNAKFTWLMTADEKAEAKEHNNAALRTALAAPFDLLVLDEACAACWTRSCYSRPPRLPGRGERWFSPVAIPLPGCWNRLTTRPRCAPRNTHIVKAWQREKGLNFKDSL